MIHRVDLPGVTYVESLPDGTWAGLYAPAFDEHTSDDHIQTNLGRIDLHEGAWPLYLRITKEGGFQLAGQASDGGGTLHYANGYWSRDPRISYGVSGHIFDSGGNLRIIEAAPHQTTQGYRYESEGGVLVRGDETYSDPGRRISEFTTYGDLTIGQGWLGGCLAIRGDLRVILEPGHVSFIRFSRWGDACAVALWKQQERKAVLLWFHVADLVSFPPEPTADQPPPPPPPPPEETRMSVPDRSAEAVAFLQSRLTRLGDDEAATLAHSFAQVNALCHEFRKTDTRWGLLVKESGNRVRDRAADILLYQISATEAQVVDVVSNAEGHKDDVNPDGRVGAAWQLKDIRPIAQWREPYPLEGAPPPDGGDDDDPGDSDPPRPPDTEVLKRLDAIERRLQRLETAGLLVAQTFKP